MPRAPVLFLVKMYSYSTHDMDLTSSLVKKLSLSISIILNTFGGLGPSCIWRSSISKTKLAFGGITSPIDKHINNQVSIIGLTNNASKILHDQNKSLRIMKSNWRCVYFFLLLFFFFFFFVYFFLYYFFFFVYYYIFLLLVLLFNFFFYCFSVLLFLFRFIFAVQTPTKALK